MATYTVTFDSNATSVQVPSGSLLSEAARLAKVEIGQPCGGQGRCGRCVVKVISGAVRRRSTLRLAPEQVEEGYALACQTVVEGDVVLHIPEQEKVERQLTTDRTAGEVTVPANYDAETMQSLRRLILRLSPPRMDDQTDDWSRLQTGLRQTANFTRVNTSLQMLKKIGHVLREGDWSVTAVVELLSDEQGGGLRERLVDLLPRIVFEDEPLWGIAVDIGTTTVTLWLVDLLTGEVRTQAAEYNGQISRGEDVISRIMYSAKENGLEDIQKRVVDTINTLIKRACQRADVDSKEIFKVTISGNSTMIHLLLGIPAQNIRLAPFITTVNHPPLVRAHEIGLDVCPEATVDCLPGVASYVGADITAGVFSNGMYKSDLLTLFIDVGTNGEIVLGNREWLVTCACSAGPAFEGAGVIHGMRATKGAIEEVWLSGPGSSKPYEPTFRVIGNSKPSGICGSGLISLMAEMFVTGVMDKAGNINLSLAAENKRLREGEHGSEYVIAWANETANGNDIAITNVDIDNLKRAKAAIYAGFTVLADNVGVPLELIDQLLIGGSFGKYINIEKAIQIGLLPDIPWDRIQFLGNTSVRGAYYALLDENARVKIKDIASSMTYIELSADNTFYDAFMSAMFFPHTDLNSFPSVQALVEEKVEINTGSA